LELVFTLQYIAVSVKACKLPFLKILVIFLNYLNILSISLIFSLSVSNSSVKLEIKLIISIPERQLQLAALSES